MFHNKILQIIMFSALCVQNLYDFIIFKNIFFMQKTEVIFISFASKTLSCKVTSVFITILKLFN